MMRLTVLPVHLMTLLTTVTALQLLIMMKMVKAAGGDTVSKELTATVIARTGDGVQKAVEDDIK